MSRRVTSLCEMKNERAVRSAASVLGLDVQKIKNTLHFTSPSVRRDAFVNLDTGKIHWDSDDGKVFDSFPLTYAMEAAKVGAETIGAVLEKQEVLADGRIVLQFCKESG